MGLNQLKLSPESLNSPDRNIRKEFLLQVFQSNEISNEEKISILTKGLEDKHDSIRNLAIEYLADLYQKNTNFNFLDLLLPLLEKEPMWSVKYLILKKISKFNLDVSVHKNLILKLSHELKPQLRIASAEIFLSFPEEKQDDEVIDRLLELWKDKDETVRKQLDIILLESKNPKIKATMEDYAKKLAEKERKKKEIAGMFEGI